MSQLEFFCGKSLIGDKTFMIEKSNPTNVKDIWQNSQFPNNVNGTCVVLGFEGSGYEKDPFLP